MRSIMKNRRKCTLIMHNGQKTLQFKPRNGRGWSVQTNGNLPACHYELEVGDVLECHHKTHLWAELIAYTAECGTSRQKSFFGSIEK